MVQTGPGPTASFWHLALGDSSSALGDLRQTRCLTGHSVHVCKAEAFPWVGTGKETLWPLTASAEPLEL